MPCGHILMVWQSELEAGTRYFQFLNECAQPIYRPRHLCLETLLRVINRLEQA